MRSTASERPWRSRQCAPRGIGLLRMVLGGRLDVGGSTTDGRIDVVIPGFNKYALLERYT